jgi:CBS domain-containing protein
MDVPYKSLAQILEGKPAGGFAVAPDATVLEVMRMLAEKHIGLVLVIENGELVGVVSERDCARKVELVGRTAQNTLARDIMTSALVTVTLKHTVPECMSLMDARNIRHLPVMEGETVVGVLSSRDLVKEVVRHHEKAIHELELERMITLNPDPSSY